MKRVEDHPVLGRTEKGERVTILVDGKRIEAFVGESVAAALLAGGIRIFRRTGRFNAPRSIFCGIGRCTDCAMTVDGVPNVRTCITPVTDGMIIETMEPQS